MRSTPLAGMLLVAATLCAACSSDTSLTSEQKQKLLESYTETAQQYLSMGELDRAEGQALKGLGIDPNNIKCKLIRGWTLLKRGRTRDILEAEGVFRSIQQDGDYRAVLGLAEALERRGVANDEAAREIASGRRVSEAADPAARVEELARQAQAMWAESAERYDRTLAMHPGDLDALNGAMRVAALLGRLEASLSHADALIAAARVDRQGFEKMFQRAGISADDERRFRVRIEHLSNLELMTRLHASTVLHELGRDAQAVEHIDATIEIDPGRPELFSRRAELEKGLGRYEAAIADIDTFLRLSAKPYEHPDVRRALRLSEECKESLRTAKAER